MKKKYITPEIEVIAMALEGMLGLSVEGKPNTGTGDDEWADRYDTAENSRPWGNLWVKQ